jgi:hypothetical protein
MSLNWGVYIYIYIYIYLESRIVENQLYETRYGPISALRKISFKFKPIQIENEFLWQLEV